MVPQNTEQERKFILCLSEFTARAPCFIAYVALNSSLICGEAQSHFLILPAFFRQHLDDKGAAGKELLVLIETFFTCRENPARHGYC